MTSRELLREAADELGRAGCPSPQVDAEWLLAHVCGVTRTELAADGKHPLPPEDERHFRQLVARRSGREPLAYILGEWGFRRLTLKVDRRVLIPRPETETVVERCLSFLADVAEPRVLDIGVGSGAIALAIADEHSGARVIATESSSEALAVAEENLGRTGLAERVELVEGALFAGLEGPFDLVVSNPPYITAAELGGLDPEVARFEPREALIDAGASQAIAAGAVHVLRPGGSLVLETADGKAHDIAALLEALGYDEVTITDDLSGRERVVDGRARS
jgi:release factor glutamine methyltransferase